MAALRLRAHAKVNLGLSVLARRGDGFHEVETAMVRIDLHDVVTLEPTDGAVTLVRKGIEVPDGAANLAVRAAEAYLRAARASGGVRIGLDKRIPVAAGLGGGSSDAAAVLRGLASLMPAGVQTEPLARGLGSDVPFFLADVPAALARGRGERLEPVAVPPLRMLLIDPGVPVTAAEAYAALQSFTPRLRLEKILGRLERGEEPGLINGLQPGVVRAHPEIRAALDALRAAGLRGVLMSGSGSTCFALVDGDDQEARAADRIRREHPAWRLVVARTL